MCVLGKSKPSGLQSHELALQEGDEKAKHNQKMDVKGRNVLVPSYLGTHGTGGGQGGRWVSHRRKEVLVPWEAFPLSGALVTLPSNI